MEQFVVDRTQGLWFHKMPSGGRGEYEVTGRQDHLASKDLVGLTFLVAGPWGEHNTGLYLGDQGGKRRVRASNRQMGIQLQSAALLMLPQSTRSESSVSGARPVILNKRYIMDIAFSVTAVRGAAVVLEYRALVARSGDLSDGDAAVTVDIEGRLRRLQRLIQVAESLPFGLGPFVLAWHRNAWTKLDMTDAQNMVSEICELLDLHDLAYIGGSDPLPILEFLSGVDPFEPVVPEPPATPADSPQIRLRSEHIYRMQRSRSHAAGRFSREVHKAYGSRCMFCGFTAPSIPGVMNAGVDAAHILPYGTHDLDVITNGIALCKLHHWAFDSHVLILTTRGDDYFVEPDESRFELLSHLPTTIDELTRVTGRIDERNLPVAHCRPSPLFISELYSQRI